MEHLNFCSAAKNLTNTFESEFSSSMSGSFVKGRLQGFAHARSLHYAYHPETDIAYSFNRVDYLDLEHDYEEGVVLLKEINEQIPFWVDSYIKTHPKEAIANYLMNGGYFVKSGAEFVYDFSDSASPLKIDNPYIAGDRSYQFESDEEEAAAIEELRTKIIDYANNDGYLQNLVGIFI